jgi:hypothetical protein
MADLEELIVGFIVGFTVDFIAGFAVGFAVDFIIDFMVGFVVDFAVDFAVDFKVEDLPPFLILKARILIQVRGDTKTLRISIQNKFLHKKKALPTFKSE